MTFLFIGNLKAQERTAYEKAMFYLQDKNEVIFTFKARSKDEFLKVNQMVSVSHKHVDEDLLEVEAYANRTQFEQFLRLGIPYNVSDADNVIPQELTSPQYGTQAVNAWDTTWDAYPKYSEYVAKMQYWAATYPSLCTLQNIGATPNGRALYVLKISDNATADETEPEFLYTSSMHGDEITGYPTMLRLIDYLLTNYGTDTEVTNIVNNTELFINPLANPDGSYKAAGNDIYNSAGNTPTRANAAGVDLNRNYPDAIGGLHDDGFTYQPETNAFLNYQATRNFVLSANYHGGTEVVNFPLDTSTTPGTGNFSYHPHDNYFKFVSIEYAQLCQTADGNLDYMDTVYNTGQFPGTTNGAAWYSVYGGRQDCSNYFDHNKEVTIEISNTKTPAASSLPFFWDRNRQALLNYVKQASYGLHGIVTDQTGNPIHAKVYIGGTFDNFGSWVETSPTKGDYHKVQIAGTYDVIFEAPGYVSQTHTVTLSNYNTTTLNVTMIPVTSVPTASDVTICTGQTASLSATGTGTIRWYTSANATSPVATGAGYVTPALTASTSYWVEREVTPANLGPTSVSGTSTTNTNIANRYLIFNCTTPTKLKSVLVSTTAAGQLFIELQNSSGVMLESKVVRLSASGAQDVELDFFLPAQNGLRLVSRQIANTNMTRATGGITYPITNGTVTITGNSGTGTFFQFFNWKLAPVKSNRDEVVVTVTPNPTNNSINPTTAAAGSGAFTLTVNGTNFINGQSIVRWNGTNRTTTFVSSTQLTAAITAADVNTAGTANVTVFNSCNSTTTAAKTFTIQSGTCNNPVPNITNLPTITGQCSATVTAAPTATSNCYGTITGTTNNPTTYNSQGTYVINWTYNDGNGHVSTQQQTVIVSDTTAPVPNASSLPGLSGQCSVTVTQIPTATDNCMGQVTATTYDPLFYDVPGSYSILWYFTDSRGNQSFQQQSVTVTDNVAPVPTVSQLPVVSGQCSVTVTAPTATDTCAGTITGTTNSPLTYNTQGTYSITWTYTDNNGNSATQLQTVVVDDTIAPVPNVTTLPTVTGQCSATVTVTPTATDNCAGTITATTTSPLTYNSEGTYTITWTYNDGYGNTATQQQTVIVDDTIAPVPNVTNLATVTGQCSATVTAPTATDNCVGQVTATTTSPLNYNAQGTYTITWTYNDGRGNTSTQQQTVIVDDTITPVPNVTTLPTISGQCSVTVSSAPTATDNCAGTITATTTSPLTYTQQGNYTVVWAYNDGNGNIATQLQTVIVDDTVAPVANMVNLPTVTGQCTATLTAPTATDNCAGTVTGTTTNPITYNQQGTYTVTWTYNDGNGNTSTQQQTVVIDDSIAPVPTVANLPTLTGECSVSVTAPTATDNCAGTITGSTTSPLTYNQQGTYTITWTYNDGNGNTSTQQQTVVVDDTTAPVPNVNQLPVVSGQCSATVTAPTATDNCAGTVTATTTSPLSYTAEGTYVITWTYNDGNGNTSTQQQTVLVDDVIAPIPNVAELPTISGQCAASVSAPTATDNCAGTITATTTNPTTYNTQGTYSIKWIYDDGNGNQTEQFQNVIVDDTIAPVANLTSLPTITGQCSVTVTSVPTATDNCSGTVNGSTTDPLTYSSSGTYTIHWTYDDGNGNTSTQDQTVVITSGGGLVTYYQDADGDGFGDANSTIQSCSIPQGYVADNSDCNDNLILYADNDGDGFGSNTMVACNGVTTNTDCNDTVPTYVDNDGDGFGSSTLAACGVLNNDDCDDNLITYLDLDGDTFGSEVVVACGVTNADDCDDNQIQYLDADGDGFGINVEVACGVTNNIDCDDNLLTYEDLDGDGFGTDILAACGVQNQDDCDDTELQYTDVDEDGFGSDELTGCGVSNSDDCNDNAILYADIDNDGFGGDTFAACGVDNSDDCDDNQLNFEDLDGDGYGSDVTLPCGGVLNSDDCDDNYITYEDLDQDGFGSTVSVACGVSNSDDCDDNLLTYADNDGDGYGNPELFAACGSENNSDCDDTMWTFEDNDNDGFGSSTAIACGVSNSIDCDDYNPEITIPIMYYYDNDGDGFGTADNSILSCNPAPGYVEDNSDCNDNLITYLDADFDGYGSTTLSYCGVISNNDCDDTNPDLYLPLTFYLDADGDGFGNPTQSVVVCVQPEGYVADNTDCNDNLLTYQDADGDGYGSDVLNACGLTNSDDCDDNLITYADADGDGYGSNEIVPCGVANNSDCDDNNNGYNAVNTYYQDADGDGFGNPNVATQSCSQPQGYVSDNTDCDDAALMYADADNDGFGYGTAIACGVANNSDCNDNQINYADNDGDGFGSTTMVACGGVTNNTDCNDNQINYADNDGDGFGSTTMVACGGATNNTDCDDNQINYADNDGDGFGSTTMVACDGATNNTDCNDNQINYADNDGDGFGSTTMVACDGAMNNSDCNDNQINYADNDGDGFGTTTMVACGGATNDTDCNDNQINYTDNDGDGFGSTTMVACGGATNDTDCNDDQINYADNDGDGFGTTTMVACGGATNDTDCNDNQINYADNDGDGFGSTTMVACGGATNNTDCNDNQISYADNDGDGFGTTTMVACGGATNNTDCNDNAITYVDNDGDGFGSGAMVACGNATNNYDCNDSNSSVKPQLLVSIGQSIYANAVAGAQIYRFRITDMVTGQVQTTDRTLRTFTLTSLPTFAYDRRYYVEVSVKINNVFGPYNRIPPCSVISPAAYTKIQASQCGITTTASTILYADNVLYATGYNFRLRNTATNYEQVVSRNLRDIRLNQFTNIQPGIVYTIDVAVRNTDGSYMPYGQACTITLGGSTAKEDTQYFDEKSLKVTASPNPFTDSFSLRTENGSDESKFNITVYDLLGRMVENASFDKNELENISLGQNYPAGVYNVIITNGNQTETVRIVKR